MNDTVMKAIVKSYLRGVLVAISPLIMVGETNVKMYIFAIIAGVLSPALRALDKKDPAFGMVADAVDTEIKKLVVAEKKKATKKKA